MDVLAVVVAAGELENTAEGAVAVTFFQGGNAAGSGKFGRVWCS